MPQRPRFEHLVHTLAAAAVALLDRAEKEEERDASLDAARGWIDLLGVLDSKTKGNLTPDETNVLTSVLTDLRLAYARAAAARRPSGGGASGGGEREGAP